VSLDAGPLASGPSQLNRPEYLDLWREIFGKPPPKNISMGFMQRAIDFGRQCVSGRRLSRQTLRKLKAISRDGASAVNPASSLKPGTYLMREWNGRSYQVEVINGGFVLDGKTYKSLSAIAKHITGAHWSGPRFFGVSS